ncbi:MAG: dGTP triphosphohydrolase, partial [bacterium]
MEWTRCYTYDRPGEDPQSDPNRSTFERDWDRLIFSSAFRRLQNKTQVFPLPNEVFVHNRLTHSLEVASVGRSLGSMVGEQLVREEPEIADHETSRDFYLNHLKTVIAAACLAHDLGNPAFGHSGEDAISSFFQQNQDKLYANKPLTKYYSKAEWKDLIRYEGNANAIRVLTKPKAELEHGEFQLCYTTLAAILKYPCTSGLNDKKLLHRKKYGVFQSERHILQAVAERTGMQPDGGSGKQLAYRRHPFVYLVEA